MSSAGGPGCSAAIIADGRVAWEGSTGVANAATGAAADERTGYLWFSMTKIATATAVMQLVDSGRVELDAPAREHLPDLESLSERITTRQLLNHSSGIANPLPLRWIHPADAAGPDPREMVARLLARHRKPRFEPGTRSAYTNIGYLVLGELVAAASGIPYRRYVVERVLRPIGAVSTGFDFEATGARHAAIGHHPRRDPSLPFVRLLIPRWVIGPPAGRYRTFSPFYLDGSAYGGLVGPAGDAARLAAAHLAGGSLDGVRILAPESAAAMQRIETPGRTLDLGLGWFRRHRDGKRGLRHVEHLGGGAGFGGVMRIHPGRGVGIVAIANVSSSRFRYRTLLEPLEGRLDKVER